MSASSTSSSDCPSSVGYCVFTWNAALSMWQVTNRCRQGAAEPAGPRGVGGTSMIVGRFNGHRLVYCCEGSSSSGSS